MSKFIWYHLNTTPALLDFYCLSIYYLLIRAIPDSKCIVYIYNCILIN